MNTKEKQITFEFFDNYRVTHHIGSELIEIERWLEPKFGKKRVWKRIYVGHVNPIRMALDFYDKSVKEHQKQQEK